MNEVQNELLEISKFFIPNNKLSRYLYKKQLKRYSFDNSEYLYCYDVPIKQKPVARTMFGNGNKMMFENIEIIVSSLYKDYLVWMYGDWEKLPPENERQGGHPFYILYLEKGYEHYLK